MGGIQSYLWELVRRLPPDEIVVLTTAYPGAAAFDAAQPFRVERTQGRVLCCRRLRWPGASTRWPTRSGATSIVLDPPMPLGLLHRRLRRPYAVVLHGGVVGQARPPIPASCWRVCCAARLTSSRPARSRRPRRAERAGSACHRSP